MVQLATKTLAAIDEAVQRDQGNAYRAFLQKVLPHVGDAYRQDTEPFRSHMGASGIGKECARAIWYSFRWATKSNFSGRMIRLFNRGHLEEARFIALLLMIGCEVYQQDADGKQYRISDAGGHFGGSGDGVVIGLPDLPPGTPALSEFKTHNAKSFAALVAKGMRGAKFEHYVQMQVYMRKMGLAVGLYLAVNKDTDDLYGEIVPLDPETGDKFVDRGVQLVFFKEPPKRINESPGWFSCKFCDHRPVCHLGAPPPQNCRTCEFSEPRPDGAWQCTQPDVMAQTQGHGPYVLNKAEQLAGCGNWAKHSKAFK